MGVVRDLVVDRIKILRHSALYLSMPIASTSWGPVEWGVGQSTLERKGQGTSVKGIKTLGWAWGVGSEYLKGG